MLLWKWEGADHIGVLKNLVVLVETIESILNQVQSFFINNILPYKVTEFKECMECVDHFRGDMPIDCRQIYLCIVLSLAVLLKLWKRENVTSLELLRLVLDKGQV